MYDICPDEMHSRATQIKRNLYLGAAVTPCNFVLAAERQIRLSPDAFPERLVKFGPKSGAFVSRQSRFEFECSSLMHNEIILFPRITPTTFFLPF